VGAVGCHRAPQTATLDNQVSINGITRTFVAQSWVIGCLDGGERTIQTGTSCAARKARMFRSSNSSHARSMRIVGAAAQSAWVRAPQTATLDNQVSINGITRTSVAHSVYSLTCPLTLDSSSFWYASQQSCPPSPYQPARLALALGLATPALLLETHTFGSKKLAQRHNLVRPEAATLCTIL